MDKLTMAHEWAMSVIRGDVRASIDGDLCEHAWAYADAMQDEADKRQKEEDLRKNESHEEFMRCIGGKPANL